MSTSATAAGYASRVLADLGVTELPTCAAPGAIQYIWHHAPKPGGFQLLKPATGKLAIDPPPPEPEPEPKAKHDAPSDWDETQKNIFATMKAAGWPVIHKTRDGQPMVLLHTCGLLVDFQTNRRAGRYSTLSKGHDKSKPNAFGFPRRNGGIAVYRFKVEAETDDWHKTDNGSLLCLYNVPVSFKEAIQGLRRIRPAGQRDSQGRPEAFRLLGDQPDDPRGDQRPRGNAAVAAAPRFTSAFPARRTKTCRAGNTTGSIGNTIFPTPCRQRQR